MKQDATLIRARLKTPRAAVIAGILFSVLLSAAQRTLY
jgi:preprotein translocase subunit Sec61beta